MFPFIGLLTITDIQDIDIIVKVHFKTHSLQGYNPLLQMYPLHSMLVPQTSVLHLLGQHHFFPFLVSMITHPSTIQTQKEKKRELAAAAIQATHLLNELA